MFAALLAKFSALSFAGKAAVVGGTVVGLSVASVPTAAVTAAILLPSTAQGTVVRIVDGDTIQVQVAGANRKVRLLNIDSPETVDPSKGVQCLGPEASAKLAELLPIGSTVTLEYDVKRTDKFGRDLAIVTRSGQEMANIAMVRSGFAVPYVDSSNKKFYPQIAAAAKAAETGGLGLYSATQECTLAAAVAELEKGSTELLALAAPTTEDDADAVAVKAAAVAVTASALLIRVTGQSGSDERFLSPTALATYQATVERISGEASRIQSKAASTKATIQAEAAAKLKAEEEAKAKAEAEAKAKAEAEAKAAADRAAADAAAAAAAAQQAQPFVGSGTSGGSSGGGGGAAYYANCAAARAAGVAPIYRGQPGYRAGLDRDNDGIACE